LLVYSKGYVDTYVYTNYKYYMIVYHIEEEPFDQYDQSKYIS